MSVPHGAFKPGIAVRVNGAEPTFPAAVGDPIVGGSVELEAGGAQPDIPVLVQVPVGAPPEADAVPMAQLTSGDGSTSWVEVRWQPGDEVATAVVPHFSLLSFGWAKPSAFVDGLKDGLQWLNGQFTGRVPRPDCVGTVDESEGIGRAAVPTDHVNTDDGLVWVCATDDGFEVIANSTMPFAVGLPDGVIYQSQEPSKLMDGLVLSWSESYLRVVGSDPNVLMPGTTATIDAGAEEIRAEMALDADAGPWLLQAIGFGLETWLATVAPAELGSDELELALGTWDGVDCVRSALGSTTMADDGVLRRVLDGVSACLPAAIDVAKQVVSEAAGVPISVVQTIARLVVEGFRLLIGSLTGATVNIRSLFHGGRLPGAVLSVSVGEGSVDGLEALPPMDPADEAEVRALLATIDTGSADSQCTYWKVYGVDLAEGAIDVELTHNLEACAGDAWASIYRVRRGQVKAELSYSDEAALRGDADDYYEFVRQFRDHAVELPFE